ISPWRWMQTGRSESCCPPSGSEEKLGRMNTMGTNTPEILIIGAAIIDVLVRPADAGVFEAGSASAEEICLSVGADALNEATVLSKMGKQVRLETIIGADKAGGYLLNHCRECGIE